MADTFETFWPDYPRKDGKEAARKAYAKAVKLHGAQTIHDGLAGWKRLLIERPVERQYLPHASTWLNQARYLDDFEALGENAMGYHTTANPKHEVMVGGRIFRFTELAKIKRAILAGNPIYDPEWTAFRLWQEAGNWTDIKLPPAPAQPPTPEERAAYIEKMKERGLL